MGIFDNEGRFIDQLEVATLGAAEAIRRDAALAHGLNTAHGTVTNGPVAEFLGIAAVDPHVALG